MQFPNVQFYRKEEKVKYSLRFIILVRNREILLFEDKGREKEGEGRRITEMYWMGMENVCFMLKHKQFGREEDLCLNEWRKWHFHALSPSTCTSNKSLESYHLACCAGRG